MDRAAHSPENTIVPHLEIANFLGIDNIIAVVNKCDLIGYSRDKYKHREKALAELLREWGFGNALIIPAAALAGDNLARRGGRLRWFHGPTMLQALEKYAGAALNVKNIPAAQRRIVRRRAFGAQCILLKKPRAKKIVLEAGSQKAAVKLGPEKNFPLGKVMPLTIKLARSLAIADQFIIRENGAIIGLGRTTQSD